MLSILIPTYNHDCLHLVADLQLQCEELEAEDGSTSFDYEILVADDASTHEATEERCELVEFLPKCRYLRQNTNLGRARIRNFLLDEARYDYCLLIDADAEVCSPDFVRTYWQSREEADILVGSIRTPEAPAHQHELRWKYELASTDIRDLDYRNTHPHLHLSTFNLWINGDVHNLLRFDPRCTHYGYEDALFGIEAHNAGFQILHLDNPLLHTGINSNADFLRNTEFALRTLAQMNGTLADYSELALTHRRLTRWKLRPLLTATFRLLRPLLLRNLLSSHPSLHLFAAYKLGMYDHFLREMAAKTRQSQKK